MENLLCLLNEAADTYPEGTFFVYEGKHVTYSEALLCVKRLACFLKKKKQVYAGDYVIISLTNSPNFIFSFLAIAQLGAISVLINPAARRYELFLYINQVKPKIIITHSDLSENLKINHSFFFNLLNVLFADSSPSKNEFNYIIENGNTLDYHHINLPDETVCVIFSSFKNGVPLGASLCQKGIYSVSHGIAEYSKKDDKFITLLPLFHAFGLTTSFLTPLICKRPFYLIKSFSPKKIINLMADEKISILIGIPGMFRLFDLLLENIGMLPAMRLWISGGEAISPKLQKKYKENYNVSLTQGYGLTEATSIVSWNYPTVKNKIGSVGKVMPWNLLKVANDRHAKCNIEGEIMIKGDNVISSYCNASTFRSQGWFHTGDIGILDEEGYLYITGRKKEMIIRNGLNVYPEEVKQIFKNHPLIKEVNISIKTIKDIDLTINEMLSATVFTTFNCHLTIDALLQWCRNNMAIYKIPNEINIKNTGNHLAD